MNQHGFLQVTQEYDLLKKRINSLKLQLRDVDQKNFQLQIKLKDLRQISPQLQKSPITQLSEQLRLDRKQIIEQFKPIVEKEGIYLRNERLKTKTQLQQSKLWEIQQKKQKVKLIEEFEQDVTKRKAEYQEKKIKEVRQRQFQEMEMNKVILNNKLIEINKLKQQEKELIEEIQSAKTKEQQLCNKFCNSLVSNNNSIILPSIQQSNSKTSYNTCSKQQKKTCSPFQNSGNVFKRLQRSETGNDNKIIEQEKNQKLCLDSRKKSKSIDQINIACQTSFLILDQNLEADKNPQNYDSQLSGYKDQDYQEQNQLTNKTK